MEPGGLVSQLICDMALSECACVLLMQARVGGDAGELLAAPAGVQFHEVTAAGLVKVNSSGSLVDAASMSLAPTKATFSLAAAMHAVRTDVKAAIFLCNPAAASVSYLYSRDACIPLRLSITNLLSPPHFIIWRSQFQHCSP